MVYFFGGHLPQTSSFRSAKEKLVVSFATQPRTFILSDRNIFYTPGGGRTTAGSNAPGAFLVLSLQTRKKYDKSPTFKIYTTSACILRGRNSILDPKGSSNNGGVNAPGAFLVVY